MMMLVAACPATAAQHPVPLAPDTDSAKCAECHEDKTKGKAVHSAIATGCTSCHEVRVNKGVTRVKLTKTAAYKVCLDCHADKDASQIKGRVHSPAVRDCNRCHDPHASPNRNQLLKPTAGDKGQNLCLSCHKKGVDIPKDGSRHDALDKGCDTCHDIHKTGAPGTRESDNHLRKDAPALCLDCHDAKDDTLGKAHRGQPFATADCLGCHDPHQSKSAKPMRAFLHPPFAEKSCETCHQAPVGGKVVLTRAAAQEICVTCHADIAGQIVGAKVQHPGTKGGCIECHNPHGGSSPALPIASPVAVCLRCHTKEAEEGKKAHRHQPAFEQGCAICHEPHGNGNAHLLRTAGISQLCLECHGPNAKPQKLEEEHLVAIFDGKVKLPESYFATLRTLPLQYGRGHPVDRHPVSDLVDPNDLKKVLIPINCLSCHQPHASAQPGLLVKDEAFGMAFCGECHKGLIPAGKR
jgi:predicted CXXCH cytochrome family protein